MTFSRSPCSEGVFFLPRRRRASLVAPLLDIARSSSPISGPTLRARFYFSPAQFSPRPSTRPPVSFPRRPYVFVVIIVARSRAHALFSPCLPHATCRNVITFFYLFNGFFFIYIRLLSFPFIGNRMFHSFYFRSVSFYFFHPFRYRRRVFTRVIICLREFISRIIYSRGFFS